MWSIENNELIDILSEPVDKQSFNISAKVKIYRDEDDIKIEKITDDNEKSKEKITDNEDVVKLGEIIIKDSKYFYRPNLRETYYPNLNDSNSINNSSEIYSWLIYKGNKIPLNQSKYRIKEGDILKIGREWLFIREIYISNKTKKMLKIKNKEKSKVNHSELFAYHSQTNK